MNKITIGLTGLLTASLLNGCCIYKTEYSAGKIIPGIVTGKSKTKDYDKYDSSSFHYNVSIYTNLAENFAIFNHSNKTLHKSVGEDSLVNIVCREVYESKYNRNNKLLSKRLSGLKIYSIKHRHCTTNDSIKSSLKKEYFK